MKKHILIIFCIMTLLCFTSCHEIKITEQVIGDADEFETHTSIQDNQVNITIYQHPRRMIYFPIDNEDMMMRFNLSCSNDVNESDSNYRGFNHRFIDVYYDEEYIITHEKNIVIKYPYSYFDLYYFDDIFLYDLDYSSELFNCEVIPDKSPSIKYLEYIDGILVDNRTTHCDYFWHDFYDIAIYCDNISNCKYSEEYSSNFNDFIRFIQQPQQFVNAKCYHDYSREINNEHKP